MKRVAIALACCAAATAYAQAPDNVPAMPQPATGSGSGSGSGSDTAAKKETAAIEPPSTSESTSVEGHATNTGVDLGETRFELHGYARMPLSTQGSREPWLVDNDYYLSGFAYTRLYEPDWSELYFSAKHGDYKAEFGLFASLYSDYAQANVTNQLGIAQASVTANHFLDQDGLSVQVGVFWDRFGYIEPYDTYLFGRTHQGGLKVKYDALPGGARVQAGLGIHEADLQQNLGLTPIAHVAGTVPVGPVEIGTYVLRTWTRDKRQLSPIQDGTMWVAGADARYKLPDRWGTAYVGFSYMNMDKVLYLAPALEIMHSTGGRGLTENYLGLDSSNDGTGRMYNLASDIKLHVLDKLDVRGFGMATWVRSPQVDTMDPLNNKDRRLYFKWGVMPTYQILPKLDAAFRFDRVIMDVYDSQDSFRVLSPMLVFPLEKWGELVLMYSHYWYGDRIHLRPGQVPLETMPDTDAFKLQAQVVW
ncbi:MAG: hypothetical protein ACM31C_23705 [Acidobacteriota bacterium]